MPYPAGIEVIHLHVYFEANRDAAVDALIRAGAACSQSECVVVHCNNSFHRAPIAAATVLVRSGEYTVDDALTSEGCGLQPDTADRDTDMNASVD